MTSRFALLLCLTLLTMVFAAGCVTRDRASLSVVPPAPAPFADSAATDPWRAPQESALVTEEPVVPVEFIPADLEPVELPAAQPPTAQSAASAPQAAPVSGQQRYIVRKGDSLWTIARRHYGSGAEWKKIADANPDLQNPHRLTVGQELILP